MEVMLSIIISSVIATLIAFSMPAVFLISQQTQDISKASYLAQKYIENIKQQLSDLTLYTNVTEGNVSPVAITGDITANNYFNVITNVTFVGPSGSVDSLKQIDIKFTKTGSANSLVDLSTVIAKPNADIGN